MLDYFPKRTNTAAFCHSRFHHSPSTELSEWLRGGVSDPGIQSKLAITSHLAQLQYRIGRNKGMGQSVEKALWWRCWSKGVWGREGGSERCCGHVQTTGWGPLELTHWPVHLPPPPPCLLHSILPRMPLTSHSNLTTTYEYYCPLHTVLVFILLTIYFIDFFSYLTATCKHPK